MDLQGQDKLFEMRYHYQKTRVIESTIEESVIVRRENNKGKTAPDCALCNDAGYTRIDAHYGDPLFGKIVPCKCKKTQLKEQWQERLIRESGILGLDNYRDATFENFNRQALGTREAFVAARDFAVEPYGWLVLQGGSGCGKTHLAVAIAKARILAGKTVLVQTVADLLNELRDAFSPKVEETFNERFQQTRAVDVLILDDYGAENSTPWATEKLFQILNYRYNANLPTVITTNGLDDVDFRVRSRLNDGKMVLTINMIDAGDYRPGKKRGV